MQKQLTELAPRFRSDLFDPKLQNHRNSGTISRTLRLRIGQSWPEDGMRKCEVIFAQALSIRGAYLTTRNDRRRRALPFVLTFREATLDGNPGLRRAETIQNSYMLILEPALFTINDISKSLTISACSDSRIKMPCQASILSRLCPQGQAQV